MDVDLRKLRYFVEVAEQLHFGRAAQALHIAQPVLSRQIKALEDELKAQLFVRDKRRTELTPAGAQLLEDARPLLANAAALKRRVTRTARGHKTFTVAFMPGLMVTAPVRALSARHPDLTVNVIRTTWENQVEVLHDGSADVSYVRLPINQKGLNLTPMTTDPRVAVLPVDHPLAGKQEINLTDLTTDHLLQNPAAVPEWPTAPTSPNPTFHSVEEKLEHVAAGHGIVILPLSTATFYTRPDITHIPIQDIPPNQVSLASTSTRRTPLIPEFTTLALTHEPR